MQLLSIDANCVYAVVAVFYLKTSAAFQNYTENIQNSITKNPIKNSDNLYKKKSSLGLGYIRSVFCVFPHALQKQKTQPNSNPSRIPFPEKRESNEYVYLQNHEPIESGSKV